MNKILQLAEQAGFIVTDGRIHFDEGQVATACPEAQKFAQLIVHACIDSIHRQANESAYGYAMRDTVQGIAETFDMEWDKYSYSYKFDNTRNSDDS